jgi:hypothetical protein
VMSDQYKTTASGTGLQQENHSLFFAAILAQYYRVEGGEEWRIEVAVSCVSRNAAPCVRIVVASAEGFGYICSSQSGKISKTPDNRGRN